MAAPHRVHHASTDRLRHPLVDPRDGDVETDASSPERRSLLALAGNLFAEVSLPKLIFALVLLVLLPALLLGLAPLVATLWLYTLSSAPSAGRIGAVVFIVFLLGVAWYGGRPLLRAIESSFWSLNAIAIQPGYVAFREGVLHLVARSRKPDDDAAKHARATASAIAGLAICAFALAVLVVMWPHTQWWSTLADVRAPLHLAVPAFANAIVLVTAYLAIAGLAWGIADATMPQPVTVTMFESKPDLVRAWRVAHVSDIHVVGERFGFRLGSGRAGPRGNAAFRNVLERLDAIHKRDPLDAIVITGDLTDAGTPAEWAELLEVLEDFPRLTERIVALPGNHDLNVVDRANPARLDLPTSPKKRLRQIRTVSALDAIQGDRAHVVDATQDRIGDTLDDALAPHAESIVAFARHGSRRLALATDDAWLEAFPMVLPPARDDGLGIIALNSNAETHFSFTNALGLVDAEQAEAIDRVLKQFPRAVWIVALHHHIVEHPALGHALAERIGTTLINGNWFARRLLRIANRAIVMHGHRHIDWIGRCGDLLIVSAPSAVMPAKGRSDVYFYIHTLGVDSTGRIGLAKPERVPVRPSAIVTGPSLV